MSRLVLGPLDVATEPAAVAAFAAASRAGTGGVPLTFPMLWLAGADVRAAVLSLARPGEIAVHEEQTFEYRRALAVDRQYRLHVEAERTDGPARIALAATVAAAADPLLIMRTVMRLISATRTLPAGGQPSMVQQ